MRVKTSRTQGGEEQPSWPERGPNVQKPNPLSSVPRRLEARGQATPRHLPPTHRPANPLEVQVLSSARNPERK
jgi:hypothetical protein